MKTALTAIVTFRVEKSVLDIIDKLAEREDRKRADVVRRIFLKAIQRETGKPSK
jgi:predicted transcriptional regulator